MLTNLADHRAQRKGIRPRRHPRQGDSAVLEDRHRVDEFDDFVEAVGNVEDRDATLLQPPQQSVQACDLGEAERGRRLVEDQHRRVEGERLNDFDQLLLGDGTVKTIANGSMSTSMPARIARAPRPSPSSRGTARAGPSAEIDVFCHRQGRHSENS